LATRLPLRQVSGSVDAVFQLGPSAESRQSVLQHVEQLARRKAVQAGALPDTCQVRLPPCSLPQAVVGGAMPAGLLGLCGA
jgi:hypothetical protein